MKKFLSVLMVMVFVLAGCSSKAPVLSDQGTVGDGKTSFALTITDDKGESLHVTVKTDEKTVGDALLKLHIVSGEMGDMGLYIKTVNGITADYDKGGKYWAFYVNGSYAQKSTSQTEIDPNADYMLKIEAAQ